MPLSDWAVTRWAAGAPLDRHSLGLFIWGSLKGCAQVIPSATPGEADLAVSMSPALRSRGWGRMLVRLALERAHDRRLELVTIQYLADNSPMHRIAASLPGRLQACSGERVKYVELAGLSA